MNSPLLEKISQPSDLKKLSGQQVVQLCADIREFLLENVSKTGGHLASNLGAVELTVALWALGIPPSPHIRSNWNLPSRIKLMTVFSTCATNQLRSETVRI